MKLKDIKESSLSRIHSKMQGSIAGTITAYRSEYSKQDNQKRNKSLVAKLMNLGYSVTAVKGSYIENYGSDDEKEVSEHSFFVENSLFADVCQYRPVVIIPAFAAPHALDTLLIGLVGSYHCESPTDGNCPYTSTFASLLSSPYSEMILR